MVELEASKAERMGNAALRLLKRAGGAMRAEPPRMYWLGADLMQRLRVDAEARTVVFDDDAEFLRTLRCAGLAFAQHAELMPLLEQAEAGRRATGFAPWDVALVSLDLPGFAGLIGITRLRNLFPELRICATIDAVDPDLMVTAMCAGANDYLIKRVVAAAAAGDSQDSAAAHVNEPRAGLAFVAA
ncbi:MAG: response regulator transcription factor [Nevskia sp.]|nr:response regulator transcription factor [Nevskia sp.]